MKKSLLMFLLVSLLSGLSLAQVSVTFNVDMTVKTKELKFTPGTQKVYVAGNFTDWQNAAVEMTDTDNDTVYSVTIPGFQPDSVLNFKFIYSSGAANAGTWENDPNRTWNVPATNPVFTDWFDRDSIVTLVGTANITFDVNMTVMSEVGIFNSAQDSMHVRGSYNGWNSNDPSNSRLNQDPLDPDHWFLEVPFVNANINEVTYYKFVVDVQDTSADHWTDGWERPSYTGGGNREFTFTGQNQTLPNGTKFNNLPYYDGVHPDWVIPAGVSLAPTFQVDMTSAMDAQQQAIPFNPTTDELYVIFEQPSFVATQGWYDADTMKVFRLTDDNNDKIYTGTLNIKAPSFNSFIYRYAYVSYGGQNGRAWVFEPAGFSSHAYRTRYINQTAARTFDNPYTFPKDNWTNAEVKTEWESSPFDHTTTGVRTVDTKAKTFKVDQNFPNPFNPETVIRFSMPEAGLVTVKVYNMLGQEVATLLNDTKTAGTYDVQFNGSRLTSGIYFYTVSAGKFSVTKKMTLVK